MSRRKPLDPLVAVMALFAGVVAIPASAQAPPAGQKPPGKGRSLDQQLLDDLDRELLKGVPRGGRATAPEPGAKAAAADPTSPDAQHPLATIAERMRTVENRIARQDTSAATQEAQSQIVSDLDALLQAAKKARQGAKQQGDKKGGSAQAGTGTGEAAAGPPRDSTNRIERGTAEQAETADVKDVIRRMWGHLPPKLRDEMQASLSEQFLPKYERLIEEYYKRLAEERPAAP